MATQNAVHTDPSAHVEQQSDLLRTSLYLAGSGPRSSLPNTATGSTVAAAGKLGRGCQAKDESGPATTQTSAARPKAARRFSARAIAPKVLILHGHGSIITNF